MILCIDVGNSAVKFGVFENSKLINSKSCLYNKSWDKEKWEEVVKYTNIFSYDFKEAIYSTVVPELNNTLKEVIKSKGITVKDVDQSKVPFNKDIKKGEMIGDDLFADLVGAMNIYKSPMIVIDLGTATKFLVVDNKGYFKYALIHPGLSLCANSLFNNASLLNAFDFRETSSALADNTEDAINSGIILGHYEMINGLCNRIESELGYKCQRIITGGSTRFISKFLNSTYTYNESLNLVGLEIISRSL